MQESLPDQTGSDTLTGQGCARRGCSPGWQTHHNDDESQQCAATMDSPVRQCKRSSQAVQAQQSTQTDAAADGQ